MNRERRFLPLAIDKKEILVVLAGAAAGAFIEYLILKKGGVR
jgi:hypothetical protein